MCVCVCVCVSGRVGGWLGVYIPDEMGIKSNNGYGHKIKY